MVNRLGVIDEINLSDEDEVEDWSYRDAAASSSRRNGGGSSFRQYYSHKPHSRWAVQGSMEPTVWVDEQGNYYQSDQSQSYGDQSYSQDGYYYDESYQQSHDYDQGYYDDGQGSYEYYEGQSGYDYTYDTQAHVPSYSEQTGPMPTGLFQSKHANGLPPDYSARNSSRNLDYHRDEGSRIHDDSDDDPVNPFSSAKEKDSKNSSRRNLQRLMNRSIGISKGYSFQGTKEEKRPSTKERRREANQNVNGSLSQKSATASLSSSSVMTLEVSDSEDSEEDDKPSKSSRRRQRADDDSDEDPHFKSKVKKSELTKGGESRSLRSKGSPPPAIPLAHIPRVSEGKVMSRKRHKSSASKTKSSKRSSSPSSKASSSSKTSSTSESPDLVCIDSDDEDRSPVKKSAIRTDTKSSTGEPSEICIDDVEENVPRRVSKGTGLKKKRKYRVKDRTLVMPIHKYYYGWAEGEKTTNPQRMFRFRCSRDSCQQVTYDNISAMRHAINHAKDDDNGLDADIFSDFIRCPTCFLPFKSRYEMQTHFEKQHPVLATKSKGPHRCKICEREMNGQEKFVQHMRLYHIRCDMPYVCPICFFRSSIFNMVVDHFLSSHGNGQDALCPHCLKSFSIKPTTEDEKFGDLTGYMSHLAEHIITKRHKCQQCRLIFAKGNHLSSHVQCDHKTAKGEIKEIAASLIADHVPVAVSEATSRREDVDDAVDSGNASSSSSDHSNQRSQAILSSFVMTLGQRAGPQSMTAEGLKAWNLQCKECHRPFDFAGHFRTATAKKYVQCNKCKFITTCSFSYAKHMIFFHGTAADRGKIVPTERKVKEVAALQCRLCDFKTEYGNKMATHMMKAEHKDGRCVLEEEEKREVEKKEGEEEEVEEKEEKVAEESNENVESTKITSIVSRVESSHTIELSEDELETRDVTFEVIDTDSDDSENSYECDGDKKGNLVNDDDGDTASSPLTMNEPVVETESRIAFIVTQVLEEMLSIIAPQESDLYDSSGDCDIGEADNHYHAVTTSPDLDRSNRELSREEFVKSEGKRERMRTESVSGSVEEECKDNDLTVVEDGSKSGEGNEDDEESGRKEVEIEEESVVEDKPNSPDVIALSDSDDE